MSTIEITSLEGYTLVILEGRFDASSSPVLGTELRILTDAGKYKIVVDTSKVSYMSSAGWQKLIAAKKCCARWGRGDLRLVLTNPTLRKTLELAGLEKFFFVYPTLEEAVSSFQ